MFSTIVIGLGNIGMHYDIDSDNRIWTHCKSLKLHDSFDLIGAVDSEEKTVLSLLKNTNYLLQRT